MGVHSAFFLLRLGPFALSGRLFVGDVGAETTCEVGGGGHRDPLLCIKLLQTYGAHHAAGADSGPASNRAGDGCDCPAPGRAERRSNPGTTCPKVHKLLRNQRPTFTCSLLFVNACTSDLIDDLVRPAAPVGIPQALCHHALGEQRMGEPGRQALGAGDWEDRRSDGGIIIPLRQQRPASCICSPPCYCDGGRLCLTPLKPFGTLPPTIFSLSSWGVH